MEVPISTLYKRALERTSKASNLPTIQDDTQELIQSSISDLTILRNRVIALSLFSPHSSETLSDIPSRDLIYLSVPFVLAEVENRSRTTGPNERIERIGRAQGYLKEFIYNLESYGVVDEADRKLYGQKTSYATDPAKRRELKIQQFKREKELRTKIEIIRKRRHQSLPTTDTSNDFDLISSLLTSIKPLQRSSDSDSEDDADFEDVLREAVILLLRLTYGQAQTNLDSMRQEIELLRSLPPPPSLSQPVEDIRRKDKAKEQDDMWKLDRPVLSGGPDGKGPLLDAEGKPLRPFTILPAGANDRARLQSQVFQAGHRLPTMSIDQYLEIEQQRGNVITGGGPASENKLTTSEQLQVDSEMDGTAFADERAEEKRQKDEKWAQYTNTHPKGAGNTMNRG
ncbi:TAP42-like protein [Irpex rosettiformis]|uniref:TAP42-like protein n=1 Tax=Irpex rosettiformis TaxID=378272 RepID=A0ACB8UI96_9APHY|nr:TAP42-like protein [Irpex rosettiformis]